MKLSIVDVSTIAPGETRSQALQNTIELAKFADRAGFERYWFAEHHSAATIAGRAPEVMIAAIGAQTSRIRLGSGAVLLNHYSVFKVAEVFCTLNELYPGRVDFGAGRATAGPVADFALQQDRSKQFLANSDQQIAELVAWLDKSFPEGHPFAEHPIHTIEPLPDLHLLGSSAWSATAAAALGLRYVFASFINQRGTAEILKTYRDNFKASDTPTGVQKPEVILSVHAVCADTEEEARRQLAPVQVMYQNLARGDLQAPMLSPDDALARLGSLPELARYQPGSLSPPKFMGGTPEQLQEQLEALAEDAGAEEIMIQDMITDFPARKRSFELLSGMIDA